MINKDNFFLKIIDNIKNNMDILGYIILMIIN